MMLNKPNYTYRATLDRVVDGDTIDVDIDVGFDIVVRKRLRFLEIDTEELRDRDQERRSLAKLAKERVEQVLGMADKIYVQTKMDSTGKYGRLLCYVWYEVNGNTMCLNEQLLNEGYAKKPKI